MNTPANISDFTGQLTTAQFKNKLTGMLLLGGYGDALGAPHEKEGITGKAGNPEDVARLPSFRDYNRETAHPWDIWYDPETIDAEKRGMPTDDTAFRVTILHQWLSRIAEDDDAPTEKQFLRWLKGAPKPAADAPLWQQTRHDQIRDWLAMFEDGETLRYAPNRYTVSENNPFFRKDAPVVFGTFMYLELAAVYASCPVNDVFTTFNGFASLDQSYGRFVSGMKMAMLAQALTAAPTDKSFDEWFFETADSILDSDLGDPETRAMVKSHFVAAAQIGRDSQKLTETDFMVQLKQVFDQQLPQSTSEEHREGFRSFDPLLFLKMMAAAVAYSDGDVRKALRVLAVAPGDSDTMASQLGSLAGAWSGDIALRKLDTIFASDLNQVQSCIKDQFGIETSDLADSLIELAHKHGCCQKLEIA